MKAGTTASKYIVFSELDTEYVDNIIFTFKSIFGSVKKIYPQNVVLEYGRFRIDFTQEDTLAFSPLGTKVEVKCEAQINYKGGAVQKSNCDSWDLESTLATQLVVGNKSDGSESDVIELVLEETVIVIESDSGGAVQSNNYNDLGNKPSINGVELVGNKTLEELGIEDNIAEYLEENPVSAEVSEEHIAEAVDAYMAENPVSAEVGDGSVGFINLAEYERNGLVKEDVLYDYTNYSPKYDSKNGIILVLTKNIETDKYVKFTFKATVGKTYIISFYNYDSTNYTRYYSEEIVADKEDMIVYITSQKTVGDTYLAIECDEDTAFKYSIGGGGMNRFIKANHTDYENYDTILISDISSQTGMSYIYKIETFVNTATLVYMLAHRQSDVIIVSKDGLGDYDTVAEAVTNANEGDTIYVCAGMYNESISVNKDIKIVGENKYTTIIYTEHNTYDGDPIRPRFGEYCNLTFYAKNPDGGDRKAPYCCHIDNFKTDTNTEQRIIKFSNCRFISECSTCVGAGTSYMTTFRFENCDFEMDSNCDNQYGSIFIHGSSNNTRGDGQIVELINCRGISNSTTQAFSLEFNTLVAQNNFFWSTGTNSSDGKLAITTLDERSFGNNNDSLNARGKVGSADISAIGDGTITGAILTLASKISALESE